MATISSVFKMQDNATRTLDNVASAIDDVVAKADMLSSKTSTMDAGVSKMNPALTQAVTKYQELIGKQDEVNQRIDMMNKQEKMLVKELEREKGAYFQNEKAIFRVENRLMNLRMQKDKLIKQSDKLTGEILEQATAVDKVANSTKGIQIPQQEIEHGFSRWQAAIVTFNQGLQLARSIAGGVKKVMNFSDMMTLNNARLGLINDGLQTTEELQNKIFAAAERSRGSYNDLAKSVSKLGLLAGDAFKNNDEMIAFSEMMNKSFKVSGASQQEISSATYQLTQAMAAGKLQGDEFRSITENAPMLADAIAKYTGKSKGELKELSREGLITSDVIKNAMFSAADEINAQYENMPRTFADATTSIKNNAQLAFQGVTDKLNNMINSEKFLSFVDSLNNVIVAVAAITERLIDIVGAGINWVSDNISFVLVMLGIVAGFMLASLVPAIIAVTKALFLKAAAWALAHWQMLAVLGVFAIAYAIFGTLEGALTTLAWVIALVAIALGIWNVAQWALNTALYACPIVWIIVLVLAVIAVIFLLIKWILKLVGSTNSALGIIMGALFAAGAFIYNLFAAVVNFVIDAFGVLWDYIAAFVNFFANVFDDPIGAIARLFFDLVDTVLGLLQSLASAIDTIFGSNLADSVKGWRKNLNGWVDKTYGKGKEVMKKFDSEKYHLGRWEYGDAWNSGLEMGNNISDKIGNFDPASALQGLLGGDNAQDQYGGYDYASMLDGNGNVPVSLEKDKTKGEVDISDEDLKMLKDIATREYMLNYKHITPNVNIKFGDVRETADVNKIRNAISKMMEEELAELYVVEEA